MVSGKNSTGLSVDWSTAARMRLTSASLSTSGEYEIPVGGEIAEDIPTLETVACPGPLSIAPPALRTTAPTYIGAPSFDENSIRLPTFPRVSRGQRFTEGWGLQAHLCWNEDACQFRQK